MFSFSHLEKIFVDPPVFLLPQDFCLIFSSQKILVLINLAITKKCQNILLILFGLLLRIGYLLN